MSGFPPASLAPSLYFDYVSGFLGIAGRCSVLGDDLLRELRLIVGDDWVVADDVSGYLYDETLQPIRPEASRDVVVVKPGSAEEVSEVLALANRRRVPVFPRGGGTGLVGGCVPTRSGIVLSLERMNGIRVDAENLMAEAEAGATLMDLIKAAGNAGLFFPPHPGDEGAQIGGLIACNAGGASAVKTGVMRNYVKGLEVVLPTGEILRLGGKIIKNNVGYDLMHLIIGSEGTLAIITKAWIRLYPGAGSTATILAPFNSRERALEIVPKILREGVTPIAIEFFERDLAEETARYLGLSWPCSAGEYQLMLVLAEGGEEALLAACEKLLEILEEYASAEPLLAETREEQERILKIRSEMYNVLKGDSVDTLDVAVPPASLAKLIEIVEAIEKKYGIHLPIVGHAGDGNLHIQIMRVDGWTMRDYERVVEELYEAAVGLGGVISGEHGIGYVKRKYLAKYLDPRALRLMREIKRVFDPNNILNPDKLFP
ncbi:MAG: FAD-binding oxidoreductase [Thaumarchaeota archaeon]|nr:MAG: FAD-binding oxidoreductase [Nitrososphaerota archaeon]